MSFRSMFVAVLALYSPFSFAANNLPTNPADFPDTAYVRQDCGSMSNCADDLNEMVAWIKNTRQPSNTDRLLVDMGPGDFGYFGILGSGGSFCKDAGYVTYRGSGRGITTISSDTNFVAIDINNCSELHFEHMTITSPVYGIYWFGGGDSTYTDVDLEAGLYAWYDQCNGTTPLHYWFGSRVTSHGTLGNAIAYLSECGETWFYGGEIAAFTPSGGTNATQVAVSVAGAGDVRVFGSAIRSITKAGGDVSNEPQGGAQVSLGAVAVNVGGGGTFHMHGGIVNVSSLSTNDINVAAIALDPNPNNFVHTPGTAFVVKPSGTGTIGKRILGGNALSPFQWPQGTTPPNIESQTGADTFVETDCDASGDCDSGGTETHLMTYNDSCVTSGPWFDNVTRRCRGDVPASSGTNIPLSPVQGDTFIETDCTPGGVCTGGAESHLMVYNASCTVNGPWYDVVTLQCRQ